MIKRLLFKNKIDIIILFEKAKDFYFEFKDKFTPETVYKQLRYSDIFGIFNKELEGILLISKKPKEDRKVYILATNKYYENNLIKFLLWNYGKYNLLIEVNKKNKIGQFLQRRGFYAVQSTNDKIFLLRKASLGDFRRDKNDQHNIKM